MTPAATLGVAAAAHPLLAASHPVAQHAVRWTGTQLAGGGIFWLGFVNVAMLVAFLVVGTQRRERPPERAGGTHPSGAAATPGADGRPEARRRGGERAPAACHPVPLLASDAERERAASRVSDAMAAGRLSVEEGVARIDTVYASRDRAQLASAVADLPPEEAGPRPRQSRCYRDLRDFAALALGAAVVLQLLAGIWELWPVVVGAMAPFAFRRDLGDRPERHGHEGRRRPEGVELGP